MSKEVKPASGCTVEVPVLLPWQRRFMALPPREQAKTVFRRQCGKSASRKYVKLCLEDHIQQNVRIEVFASLRAITSNVLFASNYKELVMHKDIEELAERIEKLHPFDINTIMHLVERFEENQPHLLCLARLSDSLGQGIPKDIGWCKKVSQRQDSNPSSKLQCD